MKCKAQYLVHIEWDEEISFANRDEVDWLWRDVFPKLLVHSNEIGDTIGEMKIISESPTED